MLESGLQKLGTEVRWKRETHLCSLRPSMEFANTCGTYKPWMQKSVTLFMEKRCECSQMLWDCNFAIHKAQDVKRHFE